MLNHRLIKLLITLTCLILVITACSNQPEQTQAPPVSEPTLAPKMETSPIPAAQTTPDSEPTLAPVTEPTTAFGEVLFEDKFVDNKNNWPEIKDENIESSISDGTLNVKVFSQNNGTSFQPSITVSDIDLTVETTFTEGNPENVAYGVLCHIVDPKNFYGVNITPSGAYMLFKSIDNEPQVLVDWTSSDAIKQGTGVTNELQVICANGQIKLLVNGVPLAEITDNTYTTGTFALQVNSGDVDSNASGVSFSNLVLRSPTKMANNSPKSGLTDKFDDNQNKWDLYEESGVKVAIEKSQLVMQIGKMELFWTKPGLDITDLDITFDATVLEGAEGSTGYGAICRFQDKGNYYVFLIIDNGRYGLYKSINGKLEAITAFEESKAINIGKATNSLRVVCSGEDLQLYVNNQPLILVKDNTFSEGVFLLVGQSFDKEGNPITIAFDNLN